MLAADKKFWVHCNRCLLLQPEAAAKNRQLFLTNCGHLYCSGCVDSCTKPRCYICQAPNIKFVGLEGPNVKKDVQVVFKGVPDGLKDVYRAFEFRENHVNLLFASYRNHLRALSDQYQCRQKVMIEAQKELKNRERRLEAQRQEYKKLKDLVQNMKAKMARIKANGGLMNPTFKPMATPTVRRRSGSFRSNGSNGIGSGGILPMTNHPLMAQEAKAGNYGAVQNNAQDFNATQSRFFSNMKSPNMFREDQPLRNFDTVGQPPQAAQPVQGKGSLTLNNAGMLSQFNAARNRMTNNPNPASNAVVELINQIRSD